MNTILGDLREEDHFNIVTFSDKVHTWKKGCTVRATRQYVRDAKEFVKRIIAEGCEFVSLLLDSQCHCNLIATTLKGVKVRLGTQMR